MEPQPDAVAAFAMPPPAVAPSRPARLPRSSPVDASIDGHIATVEAAMARTAAWRASQQVISAACGTCGLRAHAAPPHGPCCTCGAVRPLPRSWPHAVHVLAHATELRKSSSTHALLGRACARADGGAGGVVSIWRGPGARTAGEVWARVVAAAEANGRAACVLYPRAGAAPAVAWCAAARQRGLRGLHVLVLDGTWGNVRAMETELPADAPRVVVAPPGTYTIFGPCRAPPAPGRISSLEAVACLLDAWRTSSSETLALAPPAPLPADPPGSLRVLIRTSLRGAAAAGADGRDSLPDTVGDEELDQGLEKEREGDATGSSGVALSPIPRTFADLPAGSNFLQEMRSVELGTVAAETASTACARRTLTVELLVAPPTVDGPDFWGARLRRYLQIHVDATLAHMHKLVTPALSCGVGYRTWHLARRRCREDSEEKEEGGATVGVAGDAGGDTASGDGGELELLAGPLFSRLPCYLITHIATLAYGRERVLQDGYAKALADDVARWGKLVAPPPPGPGDVGAPVRTRGGGPDAAAAAAPQVSGLPQMPPAASPALAASIAEGEVAGGNAAAPVAGMRRRRQRRVARLPSCPAAQRTPLACTCRALYTLAAGSFSGSWPAELQQSQWLDYDSEVAAKAKVSSGVPI